MADGDYSQSVAVVYPAAWPPDQAKAHCTIVYLGEIPDLPFGRADLQAAVDASGIAAPGQTVTTGEETFGEERDTHVVTLGGIRLPANYARMKLALANAGIPYDEKWPDHRPHVTCPGGLGVPLMIELGAPAVWWGDER